MSLGLFCVFVWYKYLQYYSLGKLLQGLQCPPWATEEFEKCFQYLQFYNYVNKQTFWEVSLVSHGLRHHWI